MAKRGYIRENSWKDICQVRPLLLQHIKILERAPCGFNRELMELFGPAKQVLNQPCGPNAVKETIVDATQFGEAIKKALDPSKCENQNGNFLNFFPPQN